VSSIWAARLFSRISEVFHCAAPAAIHPPSFRERRMENPFFWLIHTIITLYIWVLIAAAVLSWLVAFNVVNPYNQVVRNIGETLHRMTEPALRPIRNILPNLGGIDISPVILILGLLFLERILFWLFA
jgi:YggT family protein